MSRVWGETAFAKRSEAMKAPVGLLSGSAVCDSRWRGFAPTSATPTRSLRKCRRIEEVKSRWSTRFSRIENLWPRDGSCPPPLRSKRIDRVCEAQRSNESPTGAFKWQRGLRQQMEGRCPDKFYKCFRIVKTQKISRGFLLMYGSHRLLRTKFLPLFVQRR